MGNLGSQARQREFGRLRQLAACLVLLSLAACSSLGASGPSSKAIRGAANSSIGTADIKVIDVTDAVTQQALAVNRSPLFSEAFGDAPAIGSIIGRGDSLEVTIWEAPPAVLFGSNATFGARDAGSTLTTSSTTSQRTALPEMMVDGDGRISIPFAGSVLAAGRTPQQVARDIVGRLNGKAHQPQVIVRPVRNANANVTVVGEVATNGPVQITPRGERLMDAIAAAGGAKQPLDKITVRMTREGRVVAVPLERVIMDSSQNIRLQTGDVVSVLYQPFSFTALGATGSASAEIPFESTGITLAQSLGRIGGMKDDRANVRGVFIFRLEDPAAIDPGIAATARLTPGGRVPVIYRVDLSNPATFFVAQNFPIRNKDVVYVSSAPLTDLQKFVSIVSSMAFTVIGLGQAVP